MSTIAPSARLVHQFLEEAAARRPEAPCIVHEASRATYGEVEAGANRVARALVDLGVRPGDRVGLLSANSIVYVRAYYGILKAGAVAVSVSAQIDPRSLAETLRDCGAVALVAGARTAGVTRAALAEIPELRALLAPRAEIPDGAPARVIAAAFEDAVEAQLPTSLAVPRAELDRAAIIYTSGSTGRPRGAVLRHLNLVANTRSIVSYLGLTASDRVLALLPFHYVYGKSLLNTHVAVGGSVVVENRFLFPATALDTLEREEATGLSGVPSTFAILLNRTNLAKRALPSLRYVTQAGGAMAPEMIRRLVDALPGKRIFIMYGATEASARLTYLPPEDLPRKLGSIGRAIPDTEVRVLRDDGSETSPGETGEIVARGASIMEGYWGDPEETARVLGPEGFHTGDLGYRDDEGYLYVAGRKRDMIKSGAHRIHPKEIEEALHEHPEVHEAAVIGVPDELLGESIHAFVVLRPGASAEPAELQEFCRRRLPPYKVPHAVLLRAELPKSPAGKILKNDLRGDSSPA